MFFFANTEIVFICYNRTIINSTNICIFCCVSFARCRSYPTMATRYAKALLAFIITFMFTLSTHFTVTLGKPFAEERHYSPYITRLN